MNRTPGIAECAVNVWLQVVMLAKPCKRNANWVRQNDKKDRSPQATILWSSFPQKVEVHATPIPGCSDTAWKSMLKSCTSGQKSNFPRTSLQNCASWLKESKIQMLEGKNLPKFTMKATSSQAAKGRKQVIASKKFGKKTGNVSSEISGVMVRTYVR